MTIADYLFFFVFFVAEDVRRTPFRIAPPEGLST